MTNYELEDRYQDASKAWSEGNYALSLELTRELLKHYPDYLPGRALYGALLYELARYDEAEAALRDLLNDSPEDVLYFVYCQLGNLNRERGDYNLAVEHYKAAIKLAPENAGPHIFLGAILAKKGNLEAAEASHRKATHCNKGPIDEAFFNLGLVLRAQERYSEALACLERALDIEPEYELAADTKMDIQKAMQWLERKG